jgi:hypothetical protein
VAHISLIDPDDAEGALADEYEAAVERAGKVYNIVRSMSLNPATLRRSMELYKAIMLEPCALTRQERELLSRRPRARAVRLRSEADAHAVDGRSGGRGGSPRARAR